MAFVSLSQNACALRNFGKNVPKRSVVPPRAGVSHVGWHFCLFLNTTHAQKLILVKTIHKVVHLPRELRGAMWDGISVLGLTPRMRRNRRHVFSDKKNKFNKTRHYTTLHYTSSFSLVCLMPLTIFSVLVFCPGKRLILAIIFLSAFHLSLSDLAFAVVNVMLFGFPVRSIAWISAGQSFLKLGAWAHVLVPWSMELDACFGQSLLHVQSTTSLSSQRITSQLACGSRHLTCTLTTVPITVFLFW